MKKTNGKIFRIAIVEERIKSNMYCIGTKNYFQYISERVIE